MQTRANPVIEAHELVTHYGDKLILKGVSLEVYEGEIVVVMGSSGCGKSTLLRHLLGLDRPTSGTVRLLGQDIASLNSRQLHRLRRDMGVAFQGGALFGSMTVGENVMLPLREHTRLSESIMRIMVRMKLELVNLAGAEQLYPDALSGGMVKRAALARALVMDPKLMFADELSAGLDPVVAAELDDMVLRFRDALGMTLLVVTHELSSALKIADRLVVLDQGEVLAVGTVDEVKQSGDERVQDLLHRRPRAEPSDRSDYLQRLTEQR